jgi:ribose transport system substrate-binding protein
VDVLEDQKDAEIARQNVDNILQSKRSQVAGLVGFYSYDTPQIAEAVNQAGLRSKIKIVGFDAEPGTLTALRSGGVDATVVQKPYEFGKLAVEFLALAQKDGPAKAKQEWNGLHSNYPIKNDIINTGVQVVTPANIGPFMQQLKKWGVASS